MIGKIYRPAKISTLLGKRGFRFLHRYKSNFAGLYEFQKDIYLHFQDGGESIRIEFHDLRMPIVLSREHFDIVSDNYCVSKQKKKEVSLENFNKSSMLRKIQRPANQQMSSSKNMLAIEMPIASVEPKNNEVLYMELKPIVINNEEFLWFNATAKTQIEIMVNSSITYLDE